MESDPSFPICSSLSSFDFELVLSNKFQSNLSLQAVPYLY